MHVKRWDGRKRRLSLFDIKILYYRWRQSSRSGSASHAIISLYDEDSEAEQDQLQNHRGGPRSAPVDLDDL